MKKPTVSLYYDHQTSRLIQYSVNNGNCTILNSFLYARDDMLKKRFVCHLMNSHLDFLMGGRNVKSYIREWKAHNILFAMGLFRKRTIDTDLSIKESWLRRVGYYIISSLFKEKKYVQ